MSPPDLKVIQIIIVHFPDKDIAASAAKSLQSCPTLCDPIDGSPPCSAVPGILQSRTLEWVAISDKEIEAQGNEVNGPNVSLTAAKKQSWNVGAQTVGVHARTGSPGDFPAFFAAHHPPPRLHPMIPFLGSRL